MGRFEPASNLDDVLADATKKPRAEAAQEIVERAAANVNTDSGFYAGASLRVFDDDRGVGAETTDFAGHIIEWGSSTQPAQAPLRRAADSVGRFKET